MMNLRTALVVLVILKCVDSRKYQPESRDETYSCESVFHSSQQLGELFGPTNFCTVTTVSISNPSQGLTITTNGTLHWNSKSDNLINTENPGFPVTNSKDGYLAPTPFSLSISHKGEVTTNYGSFVLNCVNLNSRASGGKKLKGKTGDSSSKEKRGEVNSSSGWHIYGTLQDSIWTFTFKKNTPNEGCPNNKLSIAPKPTPANAFLAGSSPNNPRPNCINGVKVTQKTTTLADKTYVNQISITNESKVPVKSVLIKLHPSTPNTRTLQVWNLESAKKTGNENECVWKGNLPKDTFAYCLPDGVIIDAGETYSNAGYLSEGGKNDVGLVYMSC